MIPLLIGLLGCANSAPPMVKEVPLEPLTDVTRGRWRVRLYQTNVSHVSSRRWCELELDGAPYAPVSTPFRYCSLSPKEPPNALVGVAQTSELTGVFLIVLTDGEEPRVQRLAEKISDPGQWVRGGDAYVVGEQLVFLNDPTPITLPHWGDELLIDVAPDGGAVLSVASNAMEDRVTLILTHASGAPPQRFNMTTEEGGWLTRSTYGPAGTFQNELGGVAAQILWTQAPDGTWRVEFNRSTPPAAPKAAP